MFSPLNRLLRAIVAWVALAAEARADCEPVDARTFAFTQQLADDAIANDRLDEHSGVISALERQIPCFVFVPDPEQWAALLVGMAIVAFAKDDPSWTLPMATALRLDPDVDRRVGPSHPLHDWAPPPQDEGSGPEIPEGVRVYVDGERVSAVPPLDGLHLVQRRTGDGLETLLLRDGALPEVWLSEAPLLRARPVRVAVAIGAGRAADAQETSHPGDWLTDREGSGVEGAAHVIATWRPLTPLSLRFDGRFAWPGARPGLDLAATVGVGGAVAHAGVGVGVSAFSYASTAGASTRFTALPVLSLAVRPPGDANLELAVRGGATPGAGAGAVMLSAEPGRTLLRPRIGAELTGSQAWFRGEGRTIHVGAWSVGGFVGFAWGRS